ncbi:MAG: polysaccharide biosynthesis C-terminal domain-containing protein [Bacteroidota bacterium]
MHSKFTNLLAKFQESTAAYQLYSVFRYGFLLLTSVVLARLFPDQGVVTQYEQLLLLGGSLTFFWVSGLFDGYVLLFRGGKHSPEATTRTTFATGISLAALSAIACGLLAGFGVVGNLGGGLALAYSTFLFLDIGSQLLVFYLLVRRANVNLILLGFVSFLGYFLLLCLPLAQGASLETAIWGLAAWSGLKMGWLLLLLRGVPLVPNREILRAMARVAAPIGGAVLLSQSATYLDAYLIDIYFPDQFAVFRYGAKELPLVLLLANAMSIVRAGEIAAARKEGPDQIRPALVKLRQSTRRLVYSMFPLSIVLLLLSDWLFLNVFGAAFSGSVVVFDLYLLLVIPRLMFPQSVVRGYLKTLAMTRSAGIELVLNIGLSLLLMQFWGIAGIALATVIAFVVEKIVLVIYCHRRLQWKFTTYAPLAEWLLGTLAITAIWVVKYSLSG